MGCGISCPHDAPPQKTGTPPTLLRTSLHTVDRSIASNGISTEDSSSNICPEPALADSASSETTVSTSSNGSEPQRVSAKTAGPVKLISERSASKVSEVSSQDWGSECGSEDGIQCTKLPSPRRLSRNAIICPVRDDEPEATSYDCAPNEDGGQPSDSAVRLSSTLHPALLRLHDIKAAAQRFKSQHAENDEEDFF